MEEIEKASGEAREISEESDSQRRPGWRRLLHIVREIAETLRRLSEPLGSEIVVEDGVIGVWPCA